MAVMLPCARCHRHVRADETTCPFCQAPLATQANQPSPLRASAAAVAAGLVLLACPDPSDPLELSGADYGGPPPPCDAVQSAIALDLGANAIDTTASGDDFDSSCGNERGDGPDQLLTFHAPSTGTFSFELDGSFADAWLLEFGTYECYPYGGNGCVPNQALSIQMSEGGYVTLIVDSAATGASGTLTVTQE